MTDSQFTTIMSRLDRLERSMLDEDVICAKLMDQITGLILPIQTVTDETLELLLTPPDDLDY